MTDRLSAALSYANRGWAVLPVHGLRGRACTCGKVECPSPGKHPLTSNGVKDATRDAAQLRLWWAKWPFANVAIATGSASDLVVFDIDGEAGENAAVALGIPRDTLTSNTGRGQHLYFSHSGEPIQNRVALGAKLDVRAEGGYVVVPPSLHISGATYQWASGETNPREIPDALLQQLIAPVSKRHAAISRRNAIGVGQRNSSLASFAGSLFARGFLSEEVLRQCIHENESHCSPPLAMDEVRQIVESIGKRESSKRRAIDLDTAPAWPVALAPEAFYGMAGEVIALIAPQSEADAAALLSQFLIAFGNAVGRNPHSIVESDRHGVNTFLLLVGKTGKGRKGTSLGHILRLFEHADPYWSANRIISGLTSGEGLIHVVRDPLEKSESTDEAANARARGDSDPGVSDKRLLLRESEFAGLLKIMNREGNTISPVVRLAWDSGRLQVVNKNSPIRATNAHISIIGHITADELKRHLKETEVANGFLNRFLLIGSQRSKLLPEGGVIPADEFSRLADLLTGRLVVARTIGLMTRSDEARELWHDAYARLTSDRAGLFGAVTSRAEAHVQRLSCIYALLDGSSIVEVQHLRAALAVWKYAEDTAAYLFTGAIGDPRTDELLRFIRNTPHGASQTEIRDHFGRHNSKDIHRKIDVLVEQNKISRELSAPTGGRRSVILSATEATE